MAFFYTIMSRIPTRSVEICILVSHIPQFFLLCVFLGEHTKVRTVLPKDCTHLALFQGDKNETFVVIVKQAPNHVHLLRETSVMEL